MLGLGGFVTPLGTTMSPRVSNDASAQFGFWRRLWMAVIVSLLTIQSARKLRQFSIFATNKHARSTKAARLPRGKWASYYFAKNTASLWRQVCVFNFLLCLCCVLYLFIWLHFVVYICPVFFCLHLSAIIYLYLFVHSFVRSFVRAFVRSFVCSFIHSFVRSFVCLFVC